MGLKRFFAVPAHSPFASFALLLLRLVAGVAFMMHGWGKIQHPFNWMGPESAFPGALQGLAALSEFGGGLAWVLGLLTPLASLGLLCTMAVAASFHINNGDPFVPTGAGQGAWELAAIYFAISLVFLAVGPGRFSLDRAFFGERGPR